MKKISPSSLDIRIDTKRERLYFPVKDSKDVELNYKIHSKGKTNVIEFTETYIPKTLRSIGIATKLAERGIQMAKANNYKVNPTCPFVKTYMNRRPALKDMRVGSA